MKLYLAAQYARREELRAHANALEKIGVEITSHWVHETAAHATGGAGGTADTDPAHIQVLAERDLIDIERADTLVLFTNGPDTKIVRGAHHFEAGYAYGRGKWVVTVGPRDNVFYFLPCVFNFATWDEAFEYFKLERIREEKELGY